MIASAWPGWASERFRPRGSLPATKNFSSSDESLRTWDEPGVPRESGS